MSFTFKDVSEIFYITKPIVISKEKYSVSLQKKKKQKNQDSRLQVKWQFLFDILHLKGLGAGKNSK